MEDQRALTIHFNDGSKLALDFPKQTDIEALAHARLDDVLKKRCALFEVDGALLMVPFENVKYLQLYPAPAAIKGHTYITGATTAG